MSKNKLSCQKCGHIDSCWYRDYWDANTKGFQHWLSGMMGEDKVPKETDDLANMCRHYWSKIKPIGEYLKSE